MAGTIRDGFWFFKVNSPSLEWARAYARVRVGVSRTRGAPNRSALLVRRLRTGAAVAGTEGVVLRFVLGGSAENHRREVRILCPAVAGRLDDLHPLPRQP